MLWNILFFPFTLIGWLISGIFGLVFGGIALLVGIIGAPLLILGLIFGICGCRRR